MMTDRFRGTGRLYQRPTLDVVVLILAAVVAAILVGTAGYVIVAELLDPTTDTDNVAAIVDDQVGVILGALLGLIAGQATRDREARIMAGAP